MSRTNGLLQTDVGWWAGLAPRGYTPAPLPAVDGGVALSSACVAPEQLYETGRTALDEFTELRWVTLQRTPRQFPIYEECNDADLSQ
jgi:hypothetical protein